MRRVENFTELVQLLPKLLELYEELDGKWLRFNSREEFSAKLLEIYSKGAQVFAAQNTSGSFLYFAVIVKETESSAYWWLLYVNKSFRAQTKPMIKKVLYDLKKDGIKEVYFSTIRLTSSYRRWVEKSFNANLYANVYKAIL